MSEERKKTHAIESVALMALRGLLPRHVMDVDVGPKWIVADHERACRALLTEACKAAEVICDQFESQCHELSVLEKEGLSDRIRYLTAVAYVAAVASVTSADDTNRLPFVRTLHAVMNEWRSGTTHDLSNACASLQLTQERKAPSDALGTWIWLNLNPADPGLHYRWVASSLRFMHGYGDEILHMAELDVANGEIMRMGGDVDQDDTAAVTDHLALAVVQAYLDRDPPDVGGMEIRGVYSYEQIPPDQQPLAWGVDIENCWIVVVDPPRPGMGSSYYIAVSKQNLDIVIQGPFDEEE